MQDILTQEAYQKGLRDQEQIQLKQALKELNYKIDKKDIKKQVTTIGKYTVTEKKIHEEINKATQGLIETTPITFTGQENGNLYQDMIYASIIQSGAQIDKQIAEIIYENKEIFKNRFTTETRIILSNGATIALATIGEFPNEVSKEIQEEIKPGTKLSSNSWHETLNNIKKKLEGTTQTAGFNDELNNTTVIEIEYGYYRDWETDRKSTRLNSSH